MKVLFLSQRVPYPPDRGDRITTFHFLRHLVDSGARVRVGCLAEEPQDAASVADLRGWVDDVCAPEIHRTTRKLTSLRNLLTTAPLTTAFFWHRTLQRTVDRWVHEDPPDLVYVYSSSMAQFALPHRGPVRLMQFAELDSDKWRQYAENSRGPAAWIYRREAHRLLEFERRVAREFDVSVVVSEVEKDLFQQRIPGVVPEVLPNGVDVDHFRSRGDSAREPHTVVFTGVMDYEPNVQGVLWFVRECWPALRREFADAKLLVVGSRPVESIRRLAGSDGIEVTGRVAEIPPYLDTAAAAIAPLHMARGVQNKVLEA
ncbi:MAG: TIGR03087 family PEP-CTERM/XrtA system glycosyltransferase, partial [Planctomycetes bacterium]|nr:TIGR03087 family PEP-CTERM/XrtA system glycosyltransferase [Planctomycetota bacterium]